jgi:hypothetical protein
LRITSGNNFFPMTHTLAPFLSCYSFSLALLVLRLFFLGLTFFVKSAKRLPYRGGRYAGLFFRGLIKTSGSLLLEMNDGVILSSIMSVENI